MATRPQTTMIQDRITQGRENDETSFFPLPEDFSEYVGVSLDEFKGPRKVLVSLDLLRSLVGLAAAGTSFNKDFYLKQYQDIRDARDSGAIPDLFNHYVNQGYFEKRAGSKEQAFPVDEDWYLAEYPDVASGIKSGAVDSASDHYFTTGRAEGRLPSSAISSAVRQLIYHLAAR